ncbi:hypothetical protein TSUD_162380 [Trifolium subterraneum]|uniref:Uncharacterized protein n=1 Tax=Trifolium subterraneum TaxID=3900 RepID=A0A2Z6NZR4_TRISU|nr:hypothetical protein TSUD_162380 [Trifolium subterraneum]
MQHKMLLDASSGGSIKNQTNEENEYNNNDDQSAKKASMIHIDKITSYKLEIEMLKKKIAGKSLLESN